MRQFLKRELPFFLSVPAVLWQVLFLYFPLGIIGVTSILHDHSGLSFAHYHAIAQIPFIKIIIRSAILALTTALCCLCIAYPLVYYLIFHVRRWRKFFFFLLIVPFWTSYLVLIYAWFFLLEQNGIINTLLLNIGVIAQPLSLTNTLSAVLLVMVYCYLPFMIMPLYNALEKIEQRLLEASADLGATAWQTFIRVTLPLSLPGIKTGLLLVLVPAFGEFAIPALMGGSKYMMVGSLISYYFLVARDTKAGAAFTIVSGVVLFALAAVVYFICSRDYTASKKGSTG